MFEEKKTQFVSSIKIKGIHLLPPVINNKQRSELQRYKQQAIKLEKRLDNCRELKKNLEELLSLQSFSDRPISAVTFNDNSHLDALGLSTSRRNSHSKRPMKLSHDIVDVSEYSSDGIKLIDEIGTNSTDLSEGHSLHNMNSKEFNETDTSLNISTEIMISQPTSSQAPIINNSVDQICPVLDLSEVIEGTRSSPLNDTSQNISPILSAKPRLIRSNSYILEAPSPILLAHLEKYGNVEELNTGEQSNKSHYWSSFETNDIPSYIPLENSEFSSMNTVYNNDMNKTEDSLKNKGSDIPRIEVIQTDISVQQITLNGDSETNENLLKNTLNLSDSDSRLMEALKTIPEEYSKQIIDLIEKQHLEQYSKVDNFRKTKEQFLDANTSQTPGPKEVKEYNYGFTPQKDRPCDDLSTISRSSRISSLSPSQSIYYSGSASGTLMPTTPCSDLMNLEEENDATNKIGRFDTAEESLKNLEDNFSLQLSCEKSYKELFPELQKEWAASVICAHVRGYLTRRLLKTERVQNLIETIKDALLCAIQLHNAENIDESDVELHRRLMNQVSAACYAFHDVFFTLSVSEQMSLISVDRQRKIDKAKRPVSAPTPRRSRSNSSRSSTKSLTPMSRSLTKV
ncbi:unnamed protein product [Phaedon cochleariae]|uniref:Uncharacterized protein n=1 Tax=Phaedon cochleariae TaxID=80249 RepID=A0A9P0DFW0_PHACE|nr:unnamed protein product [Phaedon cochleariae]